MKLKRKKMGKRIKEVNESACSLIAWHCVNRVCVNEINGCTCY